MTRSLLLAPLLAACSFTPGSATGADGRVDGVTAHDGHATDGPPGDAPVVDASIDASGDAHPADGGVVDVVHVPAGAEAPGTGDLVLGAATIDTAALTVGSALPTGVTLVATAQAGGGPELAVLHVHDLTINGVTQVVGGRPLVVIADTIEISGTLDGGARHQVPGPGGATAGVGAGVAGENHSYDDTGGGGGSFGGAGAAGGGATCSTGCIPSKVFPGGAAGATYDPGLTSLTGGSGGGASYFPGAPTSCIATAPGAGGGAIELYAATSITVSGVINVGGGGGRGGVACGFPLNWLAGHGGGAGGALVLQAPSVAVSGALSANGGGGGGSGGGNGDGGDGHDAIGVGAAIGGTGNGSLSAAGGAGATGPSAAAPGGLGPDLGNGGGGGGGVGQIVIFYRTASGVTQASPTPTTATY